MQAHRLSRRGTIPARNPRRDRRVFALEGREIGALAFRAMRRDPDALPGNDEATEIFEEMRELQIAGRHGAGAVKGEILVDRALAAVERRIDRCKRLNDPASSCG